ncbi:multidrug efflux SMR transporter [uncultured Methylobacterium sp.]|jgi:small multidrug resistance pump|uniref:DMT family transporter n=1 Tax=uncultured Methylobacterium sp. TaxID=157278 RepID=UPI002601CDEA|nr:multidrug efflux SMR transporter [uncultured Methylobacterium sp.]
MNPYLLLAVAIVFELAGTTSLKASDGFTKPLPTVIMVVSYVLTFWLMALIVRDLPIATMNAIWAGAGIAGTAAIGAVFFREALSSTDYLGIGLILAGTLVLTLLSNRGMHA